MKNPKVTTSIYLETRFPNTAGLFPVKLRITYLRKQKYYSIKNIPIENFEKSELNNNSIFFDKLFFSIGEFTSCTSDKPRGISKDYKTFFTAIEHVAQKTANSVIPFSFTEFETTFFKIQSHANSLQELYTEKIKELKKENRIGTSESYDLSLKSLIKFYGKKTLDFEQITVDFLNDYQKWMLSNKKSYTTIGIYLRNLRHILNKAKNQDFITAKAYPFGKRENKFEIPTGNNIKKALSLSEIKLIYNYQPENLMQQKAKDYWLFSYLCNGMNIADVVNLKYENIKGNTFEFYRKKTINTTNEKKKISVKITEHVKIILDRLKCEPSKPENYIFPIITDNMQPDEKHRKVKQHIHNINTHLRIITKKIGIDKDITTYFARHSYSTILRDSGAPVEFISEQLGHQNLKTTQSYLDSFQDEIREKYANVLTDF
jgi:integrase